MNLGEMKDWVVRTTKRPEKRDEQIQDAVNAALEWAGTRADFSADLVEGSTPLESSVYAQSIVIATVMPRFRKVKYLKPLGYRKPLSWHDPSKIFDKNGCQAVDVWYRAGTNLVLSLSVLQTTLLYCYFTYPTFLTDDEETHWMLEEIRTCIHDLACWRVFEQIGNGEEATRFASLGNAFLTSHKADLQDGVSHS